MTLTEKITNDLKEAMKKKEAEKLSVLRMLNAALQNETIALGKKDAGLNDDEAIKVIKKEVKKRKDSVDQFMAGGRTELAEKEKREMEILAAYLPAEMSEEELKKIVAEVLAEMGEVAPSQFGVVMKAVMAKAGGQADGAVISKLVKEGLNK
jgi:uncharacterized protein YqeY